MQTAIASDGRSFAMSFRASSMSADNLTDYLGVPKYRYVEVEDQDQVGIVTGLAWTFGVKFPFFF
jgi:ATP-dependent Lon protease